MDGIDRVAKFRKLGVILQETLSMKEHVNDVLADCTHMLYAMNILRSHGLPMRELQLVFNAKILSKIVYASPAWWGLMGREELLRIDSFLRCAKKLGYYHTNGKMFEELCLTADDKLFKKIQANNNHVLHQFLPEKNRLFTIFVRENMILYYHLRMIETSSIEFYLSNYICILLDSLPSPSSDYSVNLYFLLFRATLYLSMFAV